MSTTRADSIACPRNQFQRIILPKKEKRFPRYKLFVSPTECIFVGITHFAPYPRPFTLDRSSNGFLAGTIGGMNHYSTVTLDCDGDGSPARINEIVCKLH